MPTDYFSPSGGFNLLNHGNWMGPNRTAGKNLPNDYAFSSNAPTVDRLD
jgi:hypothetical protein